MASPGRILIVDDDAGATSALREILTMDGYQVEVAHDGRAALARLDTFAPDLVLCDMSMPGMDGLTFIAQARQRGKPFACALMTAHDSGRDTARSIAADLLPKPIDLARLQQVVGRAMETVSARRG